MKKMRYSGLTVSLDYELSDIVKQLEKKLSVKGQELTSVTVFKRSVDARKFPVTYSLTVDFEVSDKMHQAVLKKGATLAPDYTFNPIEGAVFTQRPVIIGFGPAGIFAAYYLAMMGHMPIVIERGEAIEAREQTVEAFWKHGTLNPESNVQFGEGGAGAFSDGKLTTRVKDPLAREVFNILVLHGAPERICMDQKPHVGTDLLVEVVSSMRKKIEAWGGTFFFEERLEKLLVENDKVVGIQTDKRQIATKCVLLAIGHSARDTFKKLHSQNVAMAAKPFAMGLRIEHPQSAINAAQYGPQADHPRLGAADYAVKAQVNGRGVYSFCMCPGGYVINSSSSEAHLVVNGMSYHARTGANANSALLITINPDDFQEKGPLGGLYLQEDLEKRAYNSFVGKKSGITGSPAIEYSAPVQCVGDFLQNRETTKLGAVQATVRPDYHFVDFNQLLPEFMCEALKEAIPVFGRQIRGFNREDAVLTGIESRSSSPLRMLRDEHWESQSHKGLFPIGEGAGYAGGITSSAIDGLASVNEILKRIRDGLCKY